MSKPSAFNFIEEYLHEQKSLTAVDVFSSQHDTIPSQEKYYKKLLPLEKPQPGQQYAFEVDLDKCSSCKACVAACHNLNGLDEDESFRDVGLLVGGTSESPFQQTVTTACHHCVDPACSNGCPTTAYEKDEVTGVVKHLDDQCIGCQYCMLKCPFDVPKYNSRLGIVRKCDMCIDRLNVGEAPACVQSCPTEAIAIKIVDVKQVQEKAEAGEFLPGAPDPGYTQPTTQFKTTREIPDNVQAADLNDIKKEHAHWPLVIMLVLTQFSVGAFSVNAVLQTFWDEPDLKFLEVVFNLFAMGFGLLALTSSVFHLGRPLYAWKAFLGLKTSWMSREIIAFGGFAKLALAAGMVYFLDDLSQLVGISLPSLGKESWVSVGLTWLVTIAGLGGVLCSIMIYVDTKKQYWNLFRTSVRFLGTTLVLGLAGINAIGFLFAVKSDHGQEFFQTWGSALPLWTMGIVILKLIQELSIIRFQDAPPENELRRSLYLLMHPLRKVSGFRIVTALAGAMVLPFVPHLMNLLAPGKVPVSYYAVAVFISFLCLLVSEITERYLFFTSVAKSKMPGTIG